jgi:hypothetical protein
VNRRYHAAHFWPEHVSTRLDQTDRMNYRIINALDSQRARWFYFAAPDRDLLEPTLNLVGHDISSSQTQLLAVLLGLERLEALAGPDAEKPFKLYLAEQALRAHREGRLPLRSANKNATDLVPLTKDLWTRVLYGGKVKEIVWDHFELIPGSFTKREYLDAVKVAKKRPGDKRAARLKRKYRKAIKAAEDNVRRFLESLPFYGKRGDGKLSDFFHACASAWSSDRYRGVVFEDPFDHAQVRWNPIRRAKYPSSSHGFKIYLSLPGGWRGWADAKGRKQRKFVRAIPNRAGDYPVSTSEIHRTLAPSIVHMIDAHFSSLVMELLAQQRVPFVALHDCWYVPEVTHSLDKQGRTISLRPGPEVLAEALDRAAKKWLPQLRPIYDGLITNLKGTAFEAFARRIKKQWASRTSPVRFRAARTTLSHIGVRLGPLAKR